MLNLLAAWPQEEPEQPGKLMVGYILPQCNGNSQSRLQFNCNLFNIETTYLMMMMMMMMTMMTMTMMTMTRTTTMMSKTMSTTFGS